jgi:hypothetical protein
MNRIPPSVPPTMAAILVLDPLFADLADAPSVLEPEPESVCVVVSVGVVEEGLD